MSTSSKKTDTAQQDASFVGDPVAGANIVRATFAGQPIPGLRFRGRLCVIATDVGRVLGYGANGGGLVDNMRSEWADELERGKDFDVLEGADLADFKAFLALTGETPVSQNARSITILYETGWYIVCLKTEKPLGKKLRRFLADKVMPKLARQEPPANDALPPPDFVAMLKDAVERATAASTAAITALHNEVLELKAKLAQGSGCIGKERAEDLIKKQIRRIAHDREIVERDSYSKIRGRLESELRESLFYYGKFDLMPEAMMPAAHRFLFRADKRAQGQLRKLPPLAKADRRQMRLDLEQQPPKAKAN